MSVERYLAVDLGAESGRVLLGELDHERLSLRELHRFPNEMLELRGRLHWNVFRLFEQIVHGLKICAESGYAPQSLGIDTWGVDFALLDSQGNMLGLPYAYRDGRTAGAMESLFSRVPAARVYELTGVQLLQINTLFQLESMRRDRSPLLSIAADLLFMPDLFHFLLGGIKATEFTFATTSQLFNPRKGDWDHELLAALDLPRTLLQQIVEPGAALGALSDELGRATGLGNLPLVAVATHDTGSAVAALPAADERCAYISSGTWSLMGIESPLPLISAQARQFNLTNEGGVGRRYRVLKNIMGLWLLQRCRAAWGGPDYAALIAAAEQAQPLVSLVDPDDPRFLNPPDMPAALAEYCAATGQPQPADQAAATRCVLESLALKYRLVLEQLRQVSNQPIESIHVIGGGSRNRLLCQFTADATGLAVLAGPSEATAVGNLLVQALAAGSVRSLDHLRAIVAGSFDIERFEPRNGPAWERAWQRFMELIRLRYQTYGNN